MNHKPSNMDGQERKRMKVSSNDQMIHQRNQIYKFKKKKEKKMQSVVASMN